VEVSKIANFKGHTASIYELALDPNGKGFYSCGGDGHIVYWNFKEPDNGYLKIKGPTNLFALCLSSKMDWILVGDMNGGVHWLNPNDQTLNKHISHHTKGTYAIMEWQDHFLTVGGDGVLTKWNNKGQSLDSIQLSPKAFRRMDIVDDHLIVGSSDGNIYKVNLALFGTFERIEKAHEPSVFDVKYLDGKLFSGGRDAHLKVWDAETLECLKSIPAHNFTINSISISPDKKMLATGSRDKTIKIWDTQTFELLKVIEGFRDNGHFGSVNKVQWLTDKNFLLSCGDDRTIILWKIDLDT
jgi:FOG: WD40 repeat